MANPMIAVVNDDTSFLDPMDESLTTEGYQAIICKESDRVYPRVKERQPDAVIWISAWITRNQAGPPHLAMACCRSTGSAGDSGGE